mmetsp:Transcript_5090/g.21633  ORF Transcript_5090/g.21633 Transcript_5090/m.21633 type:complete len:520 (+) Transcript_5090:1087-2646(+)
MGLRTPLRRSCKVASCPSITGISLSMSTRSNGADCEPCSAVAAAAHARTACSPSPTSVTSRSSRRSRRASIVRVGTESSTTNTRGRSVRCAFAFAAGPGPVASGFTGLFVSKSPSGESLSPGSEASRERLPLPSEVSADSSAGGEPPWRRGDFPFAAATVAAGAAVTAAAGAGTSCSYRNDLLLMFMNVPGPDLEVLARGSAAFSISAERAPPAPNAAARLRCFDATAAAAVSATAATRLGAVSRDGPASASASAAARAPQSPVCASSSLSLDSVSISRVFSLCSLPLCSAAAPTPRRLSRFAVAMRDSGRDGGLDLVIAAGLSGMRVANGLFHGPAAAVTSPAPCARSSIRLSIGRVSAGTRMMIAVPPLSLGVELGTWRTRISPPCSSASMRATCRSRAAAAGANTRSFEAASPRKSSSAARSSERIASLSHMLQRAARRAPPAARCNGSRSMRSNSFAVVHRAFSPPPARPLCCSSVPTSAPCVDRSQAANSSARGESTRSARCLQSSTTSTETHS